MLAAIPMQGLTAYCLLTASTVLKAGVIDAFRAQAMTGGILGQYACVRQFPEADFTDDLRAITVPALFLHGDDDQNVPLEMSARLAVELVPNAVLKVYRGGSHGGDAVQGFAPGDRVMGIVGGGGYAELARIDYRIAPIAFRAKIRGRFLPIQ
ncbi:hypothetical protein CBM2599_B120063 [Cupriavidus taiwanensis]|uniref:Uncharacterized protein n=1 Tax=Cupriavidus taiwanensis TaxID=164546 RepID=A0A976FXY6_9BURK|nr:hypothetical protein CBM2599_B120063 [Cupriavidus taiwanensis]SOY98263.1 hypothetical protein CBM2600_B130064 [Cupriavidus taiwanensis]SPD67724.1 protein of unknown function [Cupriavidus taiwanensis]